MGFVADVFGGIGDALFGSDGEPAQVIDTTDPKFQELRTPVSNSLSGLISNSGNVPGLQNPSRAPAPLTGPEQSFLQQIQQLAGGQNQLQTAGREQLLNTIQGGNLQGNPHLEDAINAATRPVVDRFNEVTLPGVVGQFKNAGQTLRSNPNQPGSSAFLNQLRLADKDAATTIGDIASRIAFQNFDTERSRQEAAIKTGENISAQDIDNSLKGLQASALPRLIEEKGIQGGIDEYNKRITILLQALGLGGPLAQGNAPTTLPGIEGQQGLVQQSLGQGIVGAGSNLLSAGLKAIPGIGGIF